MTQRIVLPVSEEGLTGDGYRVERVTMANIADEPDEWMYCHDAFVPFCSDELHEVPALIAGFMKFTDLYRDDADYVYHKTIDGSKCAAMIRVRFDAGRVAGWKLLSDAIREFDVDTGDVVMLPNGTMIGLWIDHVGNPVCVAAISEKSPATWYPYWQCNPDQILKGRVLRVAETLEYTLK